MGKTIEKRLLNIMKNTIQEMRRSDAIEPFSFMEVLLSIIIDWRDAIGVMDRAYKAMGGLVNVRSNANIDAGLESMRELRAMAEEFKNGGLDA